MKVRIEYDSTFEEEEIVIKCAKLDNRVSKLKDIIENFENKNKVISFYKEKKEFYISTSDVLFFETSASGVDAHTKDDVYKVKYKLYELDEILDKNFIRISKSSIVNIGKIYSITYNIASSSLIDFHNSYKKVYASRFYSKALKHKLEERRNI